MDEPLNERSIILAEIAKPMVADFEQYLAELKELNQSLSSATQNLESKLRDAKIIVPVSKLEMDQSGMQAVDAASLCDSAVEVSTAHALGCLIANHIPKTISRRILGQNTPDFNTLHVILRLGAEFELLKDVKDYTILDGSFWSALMNSNQVVTKMRWAEKMDEPTYKKYRPELKNNFRTGGYFIQMLRNKNIIAMSKAASSTVYSDEYDILPPMSDRTLLSEILREGEATRPRSLTVGTKGKFGVEQDIDDYEEIRKIYNESLQVMFYRPWKFQRAYRIEFHDGIDLEKLLAKVKWETRILGIMEPISQFMADYTVKQIHKIAELYSHLAAREYPRLSHKYRT